MPTGPHLPRPRPTRRPLPRPRPTRPNGSRRPRRRGARRPTRPRRRPGRRRPDQTSRTRAIPSAAPPPGSWPTWRPASTSPPPPASARSRPSCSRSTAGSSTATCARTRGGKVSFTHLIGYAVVRAIADAVPAMNNSFVEAADGKPRIVHNQHVNLGLAVDVEKKDGSRTLLVPVIKDADTLDFRGFWGAYEDLIRKVRSNKLTPDDFAGATVIAHQPRHHRNRPVGAPAHARPGPDRRRRAARLPGRLPGRRPRDAGRARALQGHDGRAPPTTTASSRAPSRACSSSASRTC